MAKKKELSPGERLEAALVPEGEWPYEVPENWCWIHVSSLASIISKGTTPKGGKTCYVNDGICFLRVENICEDGTISHEGIMHIDEEMHKGYLKRSVLQEGDILVSIAGTLGKTAIVRSIDLPMNTNQAVSFIRLNNKIINSWFVKMAFDNPVIQEHLLSQTKVTSIPNLTLEIIGKCPLPLPPLPEQHRIVSRIESLFSKLDEAKEAAQAVVDGFEDRKAAILHKAFTGELTREWRDKNNILLSSWKTVQLQDVCEKITCGKTPKEYISEEGEIPYLKVYNIVNNEIDFDSNPQFIPKEIHSGKLKSSMLKPYDVVMNIVGPPLRKIAVVPDIYKEWNMNQAIVRFRPKPQLYYRYLYYSLVYPKTLDEIINDTKGVVGQANISISQSRNIEIGLPTLEEQHEIVKALERLVSNEIRVKENANYAIELVELLKKTILVRAFRGELGTNDPSEISSMELLKSII